MSSPIEFCKGGGCTAKLGAQAMNRVLEKLPHGNRDENLLIGFDSRDDAAVYRITDDLAAVQTLDFFPPMLDDPYTFGQIAACNALSDVYAMGGEVKTALNIVCFPESMSLNVLGEILRGGSEKVAEAGGVLAGGHSIADDSVKYGLSVMGLVDPQHMYANNGGEPGARLILTKKLGVGIICTANRIGAAPETAMQEAVASMLKLNKGASEVLRRFPVQACTDVTGYGLLGHLHEMMDGRLSCRIRIGDVPVIDAALALADEFYLTAAAQKNRNYIGPFVRFEDVPFAWEEVLFDPQTSGGLLAAVAADAAGDCVRELQQSGLPARIIGEILAREETEITVQGI